jgi:hypothetical protein
MRLSFALWGGRFNPIITVDQEEQARELVDLFRVDIILPVGDSDVVKVRKSRLLRQSFEIVHHFRAQMDFHGLFLARVAGSPSLSIWKNHIPSS